MFEVSHRLEIRQFHSI